MTTWAVTGATGFVGSHLVQRLLRDGVSVRALTRGFGARAAPDVEHVHVSLLDRRSLARALKGCDVLVHLAAPRRPARGGHRSGDRALLVRGAETVFRAAREAGVSRCVFASSTSVFGRAWTPVDERTRPAPAIPYARDKLEGDRRVCRLAETAEGEVVIVRMSEIFGPGSNAHGALIRAVERGDMRVVGSGRKSHQILEVRDAVRALVAAGGATLAQPITVLVASGAGNTFREWIESISRAVGKPVAFTPGLERPGRWALKTLSWIPGSERLPRFGQLDYSLRPRSYDVTRSLATLGNYHHSPFEEAVREMVREHRRGGAVA